jgi:hypothetical protein
VSRSKINGIDGKRLYWSTVAISPNIRGRMKKTQNRCISIERNMRATELLSRRKTLSLCSGRSHLATSLSANVKSGLVTPLGSRR